jgi:hypothetical protein
MNVKNASSVVLVTSVMGMCLSIYGNGGSSSGSGGGGSGGNGLCDSFAFASHHLHLRTT